MNNKERYDLYKANGIIQHGTEEDRIKLLVDRLLESLYIPKEGENEFIADWLRISDMGINKDEPINWGDLSCMVEKMDEIYLVIIEEAAPKVCRSFCVYVEKYMKSWGWPVHVETEW